MVMLAAYECRDWIMPRGMCRAESRSLMWSPDRRIRHGSQQPHDD
jgi:hypothetical protein